MGSSYSDLYLYFKVKKDKNGEPNNKGSHNGDNKIFTVKVSKSNYQGCVNFEKVIHTITFKPTSEGLKYNILLNDSCDKDKDKGKIIFGYYYPSDLQEVLKELHVYYSVLAPNDPLVVSFVTRGGQTHNFLYSGLLSTRWVRAYSISYYSLGQDVSSELLTKEFRKSHRNRKIQFVTGTNIKEVSGNKQNLDNGTCYRYIYYPNGDASVLGSECLNNINSKTSMPESPKPAETPKPSVSSSSAGEGSSSSTPAKANSTSNYDNKIDPYYLDFVNGHHYDGVILYFVKDNKNEGKPNGSSQTVGSGASSPSGKNGANGQGKAQNDNYDHNMAVLLELIDKCEPKTHFQRKDKLGNWWSKENFKYDNDKELIDKLKEYQKSAEANDSTTFILENRKPYKGVSDVKHEGSDKITYSKYTHSATASNKPNFLFRKDEIKIGKYTPNNDKTKSLDVYFLKIDNTEQGYPFIIMITNEDEKAAGASSAGSSQAAAAQPQQPSNGNGQQQPQQSPAPASPTEPKTCKKCYFSSENYEFKDWQELKIDENLKPEKSKEKQEPEKDPGQELENKLKERLAKIEEYGKCTKDINILRSIAYQVLIGKDEPDTTKEAPPEPPEKRPPLKVFQEKGTGTSLPVVLGSVAGGLVVLGIISAIIYGIYWYNTTIKLLT